MAGAEVDFTTVEEVNAVINGSKVQSNVGFGRQNFVKLERNKMATVVKGVAKVETPAPAKLKNKPGRPKGSKNRPRTAEEIASGKGISTRTVIRAWEDISPEGQKLILQATEAEEQSAIQKELHHDLLIEIRNIVGDSFVHPERGELTIMTRQNCSFWRAKPSWSAGARAKHQEAKRKQAA